MKYLLVIVVMLLGTAAMAHPHHDCPPEHPECGDHQHPGGGPK